MYENLLKIAINHMNVKNTTYNINILSPTLERNVMSEYLLQSRSSTKPGLLLKVWSQTLLGIRIT